MTTESIRRFSHDATERQIFRAFLRSCYRRSGLTDIEFAAYAQRKLKFHCTPKQVENGRQLLKIKGNRFKEAPPPVAPIAVQAPPPVAPIPQVSSTWPVTGENTLHIPGMAMKRDVDTLVNLLCTVESRIAMIESDLRGMRRDMGGRIGLDTGKTIVPKWTANGGAHA